VGARLDRRQVAIANPVAMERGRAQEHDALAVGLGDQRSEPRLYGKRRYFSSEAAQDAVPERGGCHSRISGVFQRSAEVFPP
jgi:hypothetical protein